MKNIACLCKKINTIQKKTLTIFRKLGYYGSELSLLFMEIQEIKGR